MSCGRRKWLSADKAQGGFTLLELGIVTCVFAVLFGLFLQRFRFYQQEIESLAVQQVVHAIRSEMHLRMAQLIVANHRGGAKALLKENPVNWLREKPENYLGEYYRPSSEEVAPGNWYFEKTTHTLVYLPANEPIFSNSKRNQLNFQLKLINNNQNAAGKNSGGEISWQLDFRQVDP